MRISSTVTVCALLVAACGVQTPETAIVANGLNSVPATQMNVTTIECASNPAAPLRRSCTVEPRPTADGTILVVREADGAFRRLLITQDGRGVITADGALPARVTVVNDDEIEVAIADGRYRLPATIGPVARR